MFTNLRLRHNFAASILRLHVENFTHLHLDAVVAKMQCCAAPHGIDGALLEMKLIPKLIITGWMMSL